LVDCGHLKETKELIGWAGLKYNRDMVNNKVDFIFGYRLNRKFWARAMQAELALFGCNMDLMK
jgi:hypothetical protein